MLDLLKISTSKHAVVEIDLGEPSGGTGQRGQVRQVVLNLVTNASEAIGETSPGHPWRSPAVRRDRSSTPAFISCSLILAHGARSFHLQLRCINNARTSVRVEKALSVVTSRSSSNFLVAYRITDAHIDSCRCPGKGSFSIGFLFSTYRSNGRSGIDNCRRYFFQIFFRIVRSLTAKYSRIALQAAVPPDAHAPQPWCTDVGCGSEGGVGTAGRGRSRASLRPRASRVSRWRTTNCTPA